PSVRMISSGRRRSGGAVTGATAHFRGATGHVSFALKARKLRMQEHSPTALPPTSCEAIRPRVVEALVERGIISHESDILSLPVIEGGFLNHLFMLNLAGRELVVKYATRQSRKYHDLNLPSVRLRQEARAINWVAKNIHWSYVPKILSHGDDI